MWSVVQNSCLNWRLSFLIKLVHHLVHLPALSAPTLASALLAFFVVSFPPFKLFSWSLFLLIQAMSCKSVKVWNTPSICIPSFRRCHVSLFLSSISECAITVSPFLSSGMIYFRFIYPKHIHSSFQFIAKHGILLCECSGIYVSIHQLKGLCF